MSMFWFKRSEAIVYKNKKKVTNMTCKFKMVNILIYSLVCNMLYFFKLIMISKTFLDFHTGETWCPFQTKENISLLAKTSWKISAKWQYRASLVICIPKNFFFAVIFFFYPFLFQLFGQCIVFLLQLFVCFFLSLPTLLQWAHLCLQLLHPSQTLLLCPGCTQSNKTHNMSLFIMCI